MAYARCGLLVRVEGVRHRGDPQPAQLTAPGVRYSYHLVGHHLTGTQRDRDRVIAGLQRGAVLAHGPPGARQRPGDQLVLVQAEDLAGGRVGPEDQAVGVVVDDALRQGLEQRPVPLLGHGQLGGERLLRPPVEDLRGHVAHQQQHPVSLPVRAAHRLVKALNEDLLGAGHAPGDEQLGLITLERLPGLQHGGDELGAALRRELRQGLLYRPSEQVLAADEVAVRVVCELKNEIRPGQVGHRDRNSREELVQHRQTATRTAPSRNRT